MIMQRFVSGFFTFYLDYKSYDIIFINTVVDNTYAHVDKDNIIGYDLEQWL